jgi:hypothetical protein
LLLFSGHAFSTSFLWFQFGGGGSFSEVLSSSYELTLSEDYGGEETATPLSEASLLALGEAASQCLGSYPHHSPACSSPHQQQQQAYDHQCHSPAHHQEFHAKFITRPIIDYSGQQQQDGGGPDDLSHHHHQLSPSHSPSSSSLVAPLSPTLPSFLDTYTPSIITTIEQRPFGAEAEFRRRLQKQECDPVHYTPLNIR